MADTDQEALVAAQEAHSDWYRAITSPWHTQGDHGPDEHFSWEPSLRDGSIIFGSPESGPGSRELTQAEKAHMAQRGRWQQDEAGYYHIQATKTQVSPVIG